MIDERTGQRIKAVRWTYAGQRYEMREPDITHYYHPGHVPPGPWDRWAVYDEECPNV